MNQSAAKRLSLREAVLLLAHWRLAKTKLSLRLIDSASSFKGTVRVVRADFDFPLDVRFTWVLDGPDSDEESFGACLLDADLLEERSESETQPRTLVFRALPLRFVLAEIPEDKTFEGFIIQSLFEN